MISFDFMFSNREKNKLENTYYFSLVADAEAGLFKVQPINLKWFWNSSLW